MQTVEVTGENSHLKNFGEIESITIDGDLNVVRNLKNVANIHVTGQNNRILNKSTISIALEDIDAREAVFLGGKNFSVGSNTLLNFGEIIADAESAEAIEGVAAVWAMGGRVSNYGTIRLDAPDNLSDEDLLGTATIKLYDAKLVNTGTITGAAGIHYDNDTIILNSGTISIDGTAIIHEFAGPISDFSKLKVVNSGTIENTNYGQTAISMDLGDDRLINTGTISGSVSLSGGNDVYLGKTGTVTGRIDGGSGADKLFSGTGDEVFDGGEGADRFVFFGDAGDDVVLNFEQGADKVLLSKYDLDSFEDVLDAAMDTENGALIALDDLGGSGSILFEDIEVAVLTHHDFIL